MKFTRYKGRWNFKMKGLPPIPKIGGGVFAQNSYVEYDGGKKTYKWCE
jgi:hypothetical protein